MVVRYAGCGKTPRADADIALCGGGYLCRDKYHCCAVVAEPADHTQHRAGNARAML